MSHVNFLEAQARNRRRSAALVALLTALLVAAALALEAHLTGHMPAWTSWAALAARPPWVALGALAWAGAHVGFSYFAGARTILFLSRARPADLGVLKERQLVNVTQEMAIAAGLPAPRVWVLPDTDPNAFATGRDAAHAAVAVTEGLLEVLSREELQAVVAHEMGHIRNRDILLMLFTTCMLGAILLLAEIIVRTPRGGGGRLSGAGGRRQGAQTWLIVLGVALVAWLVSRIVALALSRQREYLADATAAELTRNPLALARALEKIHRASEPTAVAHAATAPLFIDDPKGSKLNEGESAAASLFSTHPPIALRIGRLEAMAFARTKHERRERGLDPLTGELPGQ